MQEIESATRQKCSIGGLYTTLDRLEAKGMIKDLDGQPDAGTRRPIQANGAGFGQGALKPRPPFTRRVIDGEPRNVVAGPADRTERGNAAELWVRLRDALLRSLDPAEREAVSGDFVELAMTDRQVVKSLLGLVMRRQLKLWREWNPWFVLVAIVLPVCPLLETLSNQLSHGIWPSLVMWLHHGGAYRTGMSPAAFWSGVCIRAIALSTWSWTSAFSLWASCLEGTIWVSGGLCSSASMSPLRSAPCLHSARIFWLTCGGEKAACRFS